MAAKKLDDQQIQHCLDVLDALALSGQNGKAFAQAQGMSYAQLRGWQMHGARWRAQRIAKLPSQEPAQVQPQAPAPQTLAAKPTMACDFIQAQVTPEPADTADTNTGASVFAHANKPTTGAGGATSPTTPAAAAWAEPPTMHNAYLHAAPTTRPADSHHPPNLAPVQIPVQILCTQGQRSALVNWPTGAPLECAQWLKAYLA